MQEDVTVRIILDKHAVDRHKEAVAILGGRTNLEDGDAVHINWSFLITYFGNTVESLQAVRELCQDSRVVKQANCAALEEGRILCYQVLKELDAVIKKLR